MLETVAYDHLPVLEKQKAIKVIASKTSNQYGFRIPRNGLIVNG